MSFPIVADHPVIFEWVIIVPWFIMITTPAALIFICAAAVLFGLIALAALLLTIVVYSYQIL